MGHIQQLGKTCTPAHEIRNQLCHSSSSKANQALSWSWLMGCCWSIQALPPSPVLQFFVFLCLFLVRPWCISIAAETLHILYCPARTVYEITRCTVLQTILWAAMFCLMQTHEVYMFFVLQGDDRTMLHCFYNDSCNTVAVIDSVYTHKCKGKFTLPGQYECPQNRKFNGIRSKNLCIWAWE